MVLDLKVFTKKNYPIYQPHTANILNQCELPITHTLNTTD